MSREYNEFCCWTIEKFSFFHNYFAIIDTADYLADQLFIKHQVRVGFGPEFVCPDAPYCVIMCKCRKRDVDAFLAAIRVPLFINEGDKIRIDTRTGEYMERV